MEHCAGKDWIDERLQACGQWNHRFRVDASSHSGGVDLWRSSRYSDGLLVGVLPLPYSYDCLSHYCYTEGRNAYASAVQCRNGASLSGLV
jgi:hypothetical protein